MLSSTLVLAIDHTHTHTHACILSSPLLLSTSPFHVHQLGRSWSSKGRSLVISRARAHARPIATIGVVNPLPLLQSPCTPPSRPPPPSIPPRSPSPGNDMHVPSPPLHKGCRVPPPPFHGQLDLRWGRTGEGEACVVVSVRAFLDSESWRLTSSPSSLIFRDVVLSTRQRRYTFSRVTLLEEGRRRRREGKERERCTGRKADAGLNRSPSLYELTIITMAIKVYRSYRSIINRIIARSSNSAIASPLIARCFRSSCKFSVISLFEYEV